MKQKSPRAIRRGVTLVEMMVVVAIVSIMAGISFPALSNGLDSIRLHSAADSVAAFLNSAMNRAQRRQEVIEILVEPKQNRLFMISNNPRDQRALDLPQGVVLTGESERSVLLLPGGAFPRVSIDLVNTRGARKRISIEPITGTPRISDVPAPAS